MLPCNHPLRNFGLSRLAGALGITHGAISQWRRVPADRVIAVERVTGIRRGMLRPDLYPANSVGPAASSLEEQIENGDGETEATA